MQCLASAAPTARPRESAESAAAGDSRMSTTRRVSRSQTSETLERIRELTIPPAWQDVWICPWPNGHIQAVGTDARGRKQYRYHDHWRELRDREKFDRMLEFGRALPRLRRVTNRHLRRPGPTRERVLAGAVRLLDRGFFRIGGENYAEENDTYGLATMQRRHVRLEPGNVIVFDYVAKGGQRRVQSVVDPQVYRLVSELKRRRGGTPDLLAYKDRGRWRDVVSSDVNAYIKDVAGEEFTAKDFRTWTATVLAAVGVAVSGARSGIGDRPQARDQPHCPGGRALPREHARGLPRLVYRPAGLRPLCGRSHGRRRARRAR